jgi:hypothetical protein
VVAKCIAAGLVGGEALSVDASLIKADVDKKKWMPGDQCLRQVSIAGLSKPPDNDPTVVRIALKQRAIIKLNKTGDAADRGY